MGKVSGGEVMEPHLGDDNFLTLANSIPQLVWMARPDGYIFWYNQRWYEYTGTTPAAMAGWGWQAVHDPQELPRVLTRFKAAIAKGEPWEDIFPLRRHDGVMRWHLSRALPVRDETGQIVRWFGTNTDITEQRQMEEALLQSEARFAFLAEAIPVQVWTALPDGRLDYVTDRTARYFGLSPQQLLDQGWQHVIHPADLAGVVKRWTDALQTGKTYEVEFRLRRADGEYCWHLGRATAFRDASGGIVKWFGTNTEIHDRKQAEAALREADRQKDEFLAMLAHELRNPMAPVQNAIAVLAQRGDDPAVVAQVREVMDRQMRQLVRLVDDLLDVSRITRGKINLQTEPTPLADIVALAVEMSRPLIKARQHHLTVDLPPTTIMLQADMTRLAQVLSNLLNNAAKFTEAGGQIEVRAARVGEEVVIRVRDNGMGIAPDILPHIFDLFTQGDRLMERSSGGGLGVGLTLVQRLVEMHGGRVTVFSAGPGRGSEFTITLPIWLEPLDTAPGDKMTVTSAQPLHSRRILIVDDNIDAADSLSMLMDYLGHETQVAHDGLTAVERALAFRPEVIFLDIHLPRLDGYGVAQRLQQAPTLAKTVLIALTGYGLDEDRRRTREAGFQHHLVKPVELEQIEALLAALPDD